jgi:cytochrome P450
MSVPEAEKEARGRVSGPLEPGDAAQLPQPPAVALPRALQLVRYRRRQSEFVFGARRRLGDVFALRTGEEVAGVMSCHHEDARSLLSAGPQLAPSTVDRSPLRPILGPDPVLTAVGPRHMRQRKLLLPHFHGEAIEHYVGAIREASAREIERWPLGRPFPLAPRMQAITLEVIMAGIFGIDRRARGSLEGRLRSRTRRLVELTTRPEGLLLELLQANRERPLWFGRPLLAALERPIEALIAERRAAAELEDRRDILSVLLAARSEEGERLSDAEVRAEVLALLLAGHETTANSLAWAWERLQRNPAAQERLVEAVRGGGQAEAEAVIEQTIIETMRSRPVVPLTGRRVKVPWRLGPYAVEAETGVLISILAIHHREELYPEPFEFRPERWAERRPGKHEWLPFGGGNRRCLGAALAMAEQRVVLEEMARRLDLEVSDPRPEPAVHRSVTMIPRRGARLVVRERRR